MPKKTCNKCACNKVCNHDLFGFENCGNFVPAADVVKVVHSKWVETYQPLGFDEVKCAECSSCGEDWIMDDDVCIDDYKAHWKYCPCCGAKMDGERKDGEQNGL